MDLKQLNDLLKEHEFFKDLKPDYIELVAGCGQNVVFEAGQQISRAGTAADTFYIIRFGQVALEINDPRKGAIRVMTLNEHDVLGWSWLFPPYQWHFDARAVQLTRAVAIDGKCLREKCEGDHSLGYAFMKRFSRIMLDHLHAAQLQVLNVYA